MAQSISCRVSDEIKNHLHSIAIRDSISYNEVLKRGIDIQYNKRLAYADEDIKKRLNALDDILTIIAYTNRSNDEKITLIKDYCYMKDIKNGYDLKKY